MLVTDPHELFTNNCVLFTRSGSFSLRTETLTSHPGSRGSSNHTHFLGSFFLGLVSLQHCHGLLHLGDTNPVRFFSLPRGLPHTKKEQQLTLDRRDSGDSSMCSSSELSISSSIPVIFPARLGCIAWIRGNKRSPEGEKGGQTDKF